MYFATANSPMLSGLALTSATTVWTTHVPLADEGSTEEMLGCSKMFKDVQSMTRNIMKQHETSRNIQVHKCSWGATGATKGGSCPRKPQSQWSRGQKRKRFRAREATSLPSWQIACTEHPCTFKYTIVFVVRSNWSNQRRQLSQKALKPMIRRTESCYIVLFTHTAHL